jgi:ABC-type branched-subunit amino acid transport system substrate-binding protein
MEITRREVVIGAGAAIAAAKTVTSFPAVAQTGPLKIGIYISEQDDQGVDEMVTPYMDQLRLGVELARSEINAGGGVLGRRIEFVYRNDLGSPPSVASVASLVTNEGCEAIVSGFVQASPRLISVRSPSPVPVLAGFWTEGTYCGPVAKFFAPTPMQIVPSIRAWLPDEFEARPFTITNWTPSGRAVSMYLYGAAGGAHTGDAMVTTPVQRAHAGDFRGVIRWAHDMESNIIWTGEPRPYSVNVVNQAIELGLAEGKTFAYLDFSELQTAQLVPGASIVTCLPFVSTDPSAEVQDFVARINATSGGWMVTHVAFTHYNAIMALKAAMERSGDATAAGGIAGFAGGLTIDTATGPLVIEPGGYSTMSLYVATASGGGMLEIVQKLDAVASGSACEA